MSRNTPRTMFKSKMTSLSKALAQEIADRLNELGVHPDFPTIPVYDRWDYTMGIGFHYALGDIIDQGKAKPRDIELYTLARRAAYRDENPKFCKWYRQLLRGRKALEAGTKTVMPQEVIDELTGLWSPPPTTEQLYWEFDKADEIFNISPPRQLACTWVDVEDGEVLQVWCP